MSCKTIGYLGPKKSFSYLAAIKAMLKLLFYEGRFYKLVSILGTNRTVVEALRNGTVNLIVMATYNTITGDMPEHRQMLEEIGAKQIWTFIYVRVSHYLMGKKKTFDTQCQVLTHPQTHRQCSDWFSRNSQVLFVESESNSAAPLQASLGDPNVICCIAPKKCAKKHGLTIYEKNIQNIRNNKTWFGIYTI